MRSGVQFASSPRKPRLFSLPATWMLLATLRNLETGRQATKHPNPRKGDENTLICTCEETNKRVGVAWVPCQGAGSQARGVQGWDALARGAVPRVQDLPEAGPLHLGEEFPRVREAREARRRGERRGV